MRLVQIGDNLLINPEHVSTIDAHADYNDEIYVIYTITMYNGATHEIRITNYWNGPHVLWAALHRAYPRLMEGINT